MPSPHLKLAVGNRDETASSESRRRDLEKVGRKRPVPEAGPADEGQFSRAASSSCCQAVLNGAGTACPHNSKPIVLGTSCPRPGKWSLMQPCQFRREDTFALTGNRQARQ